jgi:hypothetical protein
MAFLPTIPTSAMMPIIEMMFSSERKIMSASSAPTSACGWLNMMING